MEVFRKFIKFGTGSLPLDPTFLLGSKEGDKDVPSASLCGNSCDLGFDTELAACGVGPGEI